MNSRRISLADSRTRVFFHCHGLVPGDSAEGKAPWIALVQHELEKDQLK